MQIPTPESMAGPTPDELARNEALADDLQGLGDWAAQLPLTPEQRRHLNAATSSLSEGRTKLANVRRMQADRRATEG